MNEIWKPVIEFEEFYEISNLGNIRSKPRFRKTQSSGLGYISKLRILKPRIDIDGYRHIGLCANNKYVSRPIHRLVAESFIFNGKIPINIDIHHIDSNRQNNVLINLQPLNQKEHVMAQILPRVTKRIEENKLKRKQQLINDRQ